MRPLVCLLMIAACAKNIQRDQALAAANAAHARGDYVGEALALRDACNFAADDKDVCQRANTAYASAQNLARDAGRRACTDIAPTLAAVDACLGAVGALRKLAPDHPDVAQLAEAASKQHLARCFADSPSWQTTIDAAVELVRCEQSREPQVGLAVYSQQVFGARTNARDQIVRLADHPQYADRFGAQAELVATASCLTATPDLVTRAHSSRNAFIDRVRGTIDLRLTTSTSLPDLCVTAASALTGRAACGAKQGAPVITIGGDVAVAPVDHTVFESTESKEYVAGIIREDNPDYRPAQNDERNARQSRDTAEQQMRRDESDCRSAESSLSSAGGCSSCSQRTDRDRACNAASSSDSLYHSRSSDYDRARQHLDNTPAIKEREDIRTATYIVKHHTWRTTWNGQLRNDGGTIPAGGETVVGDLETSGAPIAGVPSDPVTYPGNRWFAAPIRDQLAAKIAETVDIALKRRSSDLAVNCALPMQWTNDWLDCWAKVRLWGGAQPTPDALLRLVGDTKDVRRGPMWEHVRCQR